MKRTDSPDSQSTARNGQPIEILGLFLSLGLIVLLLMIFREFLTPILTRSGNMASDPYIVQGHTWFVQLLANMELVFVIISVFGLISLAVFRSRVGA